MAGSATCWHRQAQQWHVQRCESHGSGPTNARHSAAQAQALSADIRSSPLDPESVRATFPQLVELARLVKRYVESTASLPADATRAMWEQRGQWLQEE